MVTLKAVVFQVRAGVSVNYSDAQQAAVNALATKLELAHLDLTDKTVEFHFYEDANVRAFVNGARKLGLDVELENC